MGKLVELVEQTIAEGKKNVGEQIVSALFGETGLGRFFKNDDSGLLKLEKQEGDKKVMNILKSHFNMDKRRQAYNKSANEISGTNFLDLDQKVEEVRKVVRDVYTKYQKEAIRKYSGDRSKDIKPDDSQYIGWKHITKWNSTDEEEKIELELHSKARKGIEKELKKIL